MDKNTLSNYGWIVICVLVLAVMIALASPFGNYVKTAVENTTQGLFDTSEKALNVVGMTAGDGSFESGSYDNDDSGSTPVEEIIPSNGTYTKADGTVLVGGDDFPEPQTGDIYTYGDYEYRYNYYVSLPNWVEDNSLNGWCAKLRTNKSNPDNVQTTINGNPIVGVSFSGCSNLEVIPEIPSTITTMSYMFFGCSKITFFAYEIPSTVTNLSNAFNGCTSLSVAPNVHSGVKKMNYTFYGCTSISGVIKIDANPTNWSSCFGGVDFEYQVICLDGSSECLNNMGYTGIKYCGICKGVCQNNYQHE